ncbi:MAG: hypothetical protein ACJAWL_000326 [Motiliproteus sp.]|jgi:hypothetical protein
MSLINVNSPVLKTVNLEKIDSFLSLKGWTKSSDMHLEKNTIYNSPTNYLDERIEILVPKSSDFIDYYNRLVDVINTLSFYYEQDSSDLIRSISSCFTDIFHTRIIDTGLFENSLPIDEVYREIGGIRSLFLYGASSEITPSRHFDNPLSRSQKFIENCRFGHTFKGSFGFTVELPIIKVCKERDLFELPFERKVNERIARGLNLISQAVKYDNADILVDAYNTAFNSKMCDALLNISNQASKSVELSFNWAKEIILSEDIRNFKSIVLTEAHYDVISYASSKLKEVPPEDKFVMGKIINLHCNNNPVDEYISKSIIIKYIDNNSSKLDVKATLNSHDYKLACKAHVEGVDITINGNLERTGGQWTLTDIKSVKVKS